MAECAIRCLCQGHHRLVPAGRMMRNRESVRQHGRTSQCSRFLVIPAALHALPVSLIPRKPTDGEIKRRPPIIMASTGQSEHPGILEGIPRRPRYGGVGGRG